MFRVCHTQPATVERKKTTTKILYIFQSTESITKLPLKRVHAALNRISRPCVWVKAADEKDYTVTAWALNRNRITGISTSTAMQRPTSANSSFCLFLSLSLSILHTWAHITILLSLVICYNNQKKRKRFERI